MEEYKIIVSERRFIMTRYMQSLIFYPVIMGYSFKELLGSQSRWSLVLFAIFMVLVNTAFFYSAINFRSMAYHALDREMILADHLGVQRPHPMIWGYYTGIYGLTVAYILVIIVVWMKIAHPDWLPNNFHVVPDDLVPEAFLH
ncbi:MAG TPA: hypothetical protein VNI02_14255 [Blastocatellia bacterium]|jgi:hypothetical protein|nr:hypothetical protein [Blastocatellia bacterium]